ncbi:MAG: LytTR family DNA-binding domain-containing protein [Bacteroidales bacterium]|nr:LytTR family DNA-binding domain-containing protein [Bacteroidales bacterium]
MLKTIIVEDESNSRELIRNILKQYCSSIVSIADEATDVKSGIEKILKHKPDLVFLDINLPDGTSFDILKTIKNVNFKIIFITAYEQYAIQAIKCSALDFIIKPVDYKELISAVEKANESFISEEYRLKIETLLNNTNGVSRQNKKIILKSSEKINVISVSEIIRCESKNNYTQFYLCDGSNVLVSTTLKDYEELLIPFGFVRIHQSHLVNVDFIKSYDKKRELIQMKDGSDVPISARKKDDLIEILEKM